MPLNIISFLLVFFQLFYCGSKEVTGNVHFENGRQSLVHQRYHIHLPTYYAGIEESDEKENFTPAAATNIPVKGYRPEEKHLPAVCGQLVKTYDRSCGLHRNTLFIFHHNLRL